MSVVVKPSTQKKSSKHTKDRLKGKAVAAVAHSLTDPASKEINPLSKPFQFV